MVRDGVVIEALQIRARPLFHLPALFAHFRAVVHAADEPRESPAGLRQHHGQVRERIHDAAEHERGGGDADFVRIAEEVAQEMLPDALAAARIERVQEDGQAELLALLVDGPQRLVVEVPAVDVRRHVQRPDPGSFAARSISGSARSGLLQRQHHGPDETVGVLAMRRGGGVVPATRELRARTAGAPNTPSDW